MRRKTMTLSVAALALAALGAVSASAAAPVNVKYQIGFTVGTDVEALNLSIDSPSYFSGLVGAIQMTKDLTYNPSTTDWLPKTYSSVCTDIDGNLVLGQAYTFDVENYGTHLGRAPLWGAGSAVSINTADAQAAIAKASDVFYYAKGAGYLDGTAALGMSALSTKAAVQLAIWEALYDTSSTLTTYNLGTTDTGRFQANGDANAVALALTLLSTAPDSDHSGWLLYPFPTEQGGPPAYAPQGLLVEDTYVKTPEPTTLLAGLFLGIPFAFSTMRVVLKKRNA